MFLYTPPPNQLNPAWMCSCSVCKHMTNAGRWAQTTCAYHLLIRFVRFSPNKEQKRIRLVGCESGRGYRCISSFSTSCLKATLPSTGLYARIFHQLSLQFSFRLALSTKFVLFCRCDNSLSKENVLVSRTPWVFLEIFHLNPTRNIS